jgi:hypothetical protein
VRTTLPKHVESPAPKSVKTAVLEGTETKATLGCSPTHGVPGGIVATSVSAHDLAHKPVPTSNDFNDEQAALHQSPALGITGESESIKNTALRSEQPSQKGSLKGRV